ncbi:STAS domain-containing protein [Micromonospora sp. WMMC241]|uniref:STAS domain-containing protein n=1 Tax=Micromonospora sp. WMMC241 TaxID=3015159 RepID=UPI0022B71C73|nr:STAS domain-containing protein [Micromonospora sp. WMMC241]MCZ7440076.1 STAS domain-containing protein [Micromonospora sp. WMMC241]
MSRELPVFGRHHVRTASGSLRPDDPIMWLSCEVRGDVTRVSVAGEVDLSNAHLLVELLENVAARSPLVAVDLSEVTFFGAHGTDALVRARRLVTERGGRLTLCYPSPVVRRVLDVTGTLDGFEVVERTSVPAVLRRTARRVVPAPAGS